MPFLTIFVANIKLKIMSRNIAIVCGGFSGEYNISIQSGMLVSEKLDKSKYTSYLIIITSNSWYYTDQNSNKHEIDKQDFSITISNVKIIFDGIFNAIHGTPGEDGKLLGYFDMLGIPYTSCETDVSALAFNKYFCNKYINSLGISTANSVILRKDENYNCEEIISKLGLPLFVKPARSGSSVGVSKVKNINDLKTAIRVAFDTDNIVLAEEFLNGREFACGLFKRNNELLVLPLCEIKSKHEFFDYEAKYTSGLAEEITPPKNLNIENETDIKTLSALIYNKMGCKGVVRIDYMLTDRELYFIEINTVPGLSEASIIPKQAHAMGISIDELFNIVTDTMFL